MTLNVMMDKWGPATRSSVGTFIYMKQWIEERSRPAPLQTSCFSMKTLSSCLHLETKLRDVVDTMQMLSHHAQTQPALLISYRNSFSVSNDEQCRRVPSTGHMTTKLEALLIQTCHCWSGRISGTTAGIGAI